MAWPSISLIVPTFQRRAIVAETLRSIALLEYAGRLEAIVVVDGSTDGTAAALAGIACPFPVSIIEQPNSGAAAARNAGAAAARGEILLFLDDDMTCRHDLVAEHARSHQEGADAVLGLILYDDRSSPGFLSREVARYTRSSARDFLAGANPVPGDVITGQLSVRRAAFEGLGGFDVAFTQGANFHNEDFDLGMRLCDQFKVVRNARAVSWHRYVVTPSEAMDKAYRAGRADVLFARKYPDLPRSIFELHDPYPRGSRLIYRPLSAIPYLSGWLTSLAARLARDVDLAQSPLQSAVLRFYYSMRAVAYWRGVRSGWRRQQRANPGCRPPH